jgi:hypothetical protein
MEANPRFDDRAIDRLEKTIESSLAALGTLEPQVLGRSTPHVTSDGRIITGFVPPLPEIAHLTTPDGFVGVLVGMPLEIAEPIADGPRLLARIGDHESRLVTLKLLTAEEYAYATSVDDSARAIELAETFRRRGDGHVSSSVAGPSSSPPPLTR